MDKFTVHGSKLESDNFQDAEVLINEISLVMHPQYCNHSEGFSWGYNGSGPAQTAFEILFDWFRRETDDDKAASIAYRLHQKFKEDRIARIPQSRTDWYIFKDEMQKWIDDNYKGTCEVCGRVLRTEDPTSESEDGHTICVDCSH